MRAEDQYREYERTMGKQAAERQVFLASVAVACTCGKEDAPLRLHAPGCAAHRVKYPSAPPGVSAQR